MHACTRAKRHPPTTARHMSSAPCGMHGVRRSRVLGCAELCSAPLRYAVLGVLGCAVREVPGRGAPVSTMKPPERSLRRHWLEKYLHDPGPLHAGERPRQQLCADRQRRSGPLAAAAIATPHEYARRPSDLSRLSGMAWYIAAWTGQHPCTMPVGSIHAYWRGSMAACMAARGCRSGAQWGGPRCSHPRPPAALPVNTSAAAMPSQQC